MEVNAGGVQKFVSSQIDKLHSCSPKKNRESVGSSDSTNAAKVKREREMMCLWLKCKVNLCCADTFSFS